MKGELEGLVAVVVSWLSGYGGYSQTPWVRVPQLLVFLFSLFSPSSLISNETSIMCYIASLSTVHWYVVGIEERWFQCVFAKITVTHFSLSASLSV